MFIIKQEGPRFEIFDEENKFYKLEEDWVIFVLGEIASALSESDKFTEFVVMSSNGIISFECFRSYSDMSVVIHYLDSFKNYTIRGAFYRDDISLLILDILGALKAIIREVYFEFPIKAFYVRKHCFVEGDNKTYDSLNFSESLKLMDEVSGIKIEEYGGVIISSVSDVGSSFKYYEYHKVDGEDDEDEE